MPTKKDVIKYPGVRVAMDGNTPFKIGLKHKTVDHCIKAQAFVIAIYIPTANDVGRNLRKKSPNVLLTS